MATEATLPRMTARNKETGQMAHTLEQNLERIADALEKLAASAANFNFTQVGEVKVATTQAAEPAKADTKKADDAAKAAAKKKADDEAAAAAAAKKAEDEAAAAALADEGPKVTKEDVRKALQAYREIEGTPAMLEVLKKAGAANLNELAEAKYAEVIAAVS